MKRWTTILIAALVCAVSCLQKPEIPFDDMVSIHHDMLIVEAALSDFPDLYVRRGYEHVDLPVIEKYGYTQEQYLAAVKYYLYDIEQFKKVMDAVKARLQEEELQLSGKNEEGVADGGDKLQQPSIDTSGKNIKLKKQKKHIHKPDLKREPSDGEKKLTLKDLEEMEKKLK